MDLSKLSTKDLVALRDNDLSRISTDGLQFLKSQYSNQQEEPAPVAVERKPEDVSTWEGAKAGLRRGFESFGDIGAGLGLGVSSVAGNEAEARRKMEAIKAGKQVQDAAPGMTVEDFERIAQEKGYLAAAKEAPKYILEQLGASGPQMATPLAAGMAGSRLAGPVGGLAAGIGTYALQQFGNFLVTQAQEKKDAKELEVAKAALTAAGTAPFGYFADKFTAGIGGSGKRAISEIYAELGKRGVIKEVAGRAATGATLGIIAEAPVEVLEQAAERWQAGQSLTGPEAWSAYKNAFVGAAAVGGGIGAVANIPGSKTPVSPSDTQAPPETPESPQIDPEQYKTALAGLQGVIPVGGTTDSAKLTQTLSGMGIQNPEEYLNQAKATGDIKSYTTPFFDVQNASGDVLFRSSDEAIANSAAERLNAQQPQSASVVPGEVTRYAHVNDLVDGAEIVKGQFKPESTTFDLSAGDTPLSKGLTAEDAEAKAQRLTELRNKKAASFDAEIKKNQDSIDKNTLELETAEADGKAGTPEYEALDKQVKENNALIQPKIDELQLAKRAYAEPVMVTQSRPEAVSEDGFTVFKDNKPVQHFATEELARAAVSAPTSVGQEADQQPTDSTTPEAKAAVAALRERLLPFMKRLNLDGSMLKILDSIESGQGAGDGSYANQVISVALNAANPMGTLRHETIHALKALGAFKPNEWRVLEERAKSEWIDKFIRQRTVEGGRNMYEAYKALYQQDNKGSLVGFDAYITEEAIADAFKYFNQTKPPVGLIGNIYNRIEKFFAEIKSALNGQGIETAEQIFTRVEAGQMRPTAAPTGNVPRYDIVSLEGKRKDIFTDPDTLGAWRAIGRNNLTQPVAERFSTRSRDEAEREVYKKYLTKKDILEAARIQGDVKPNPTTEEGSAGNQYIQKLLNERSNDRYLDEIKELKKAGPTEMGRAQEAFGETVEDNRTDAQKARGTMAYNRERIEFLKKTPEELQDLAAQHAYGVAYSDQAESYQESQAEGVTLSDAELEKIGDAAYKNAYGKELTRLQNRQEKLRSERGVPRYDLSKKPTKVMTMADLGKVIPASERVVSKKPGRLLNGKKFSDADLKNVGEGFLVYKEYGESDAEGRVKKIWEESIADVENFVSGSREGAFIKDLVKSLGAKPPKAKFLNDSLSLPDSARYWYETSAEAFDQTTLNTKNKDLLINIISATSQNVPPLPNMRRGISVISEYFQNKPIETDLISKKPVADAISNRNIQTLKFGNFADTMKFINGYTKNPPVSTNDRQVAAIFNMEPDEFAKNPVLYAVVSKFYAKIRDSQNEMQGKGKQPYESWQIQALNWVEERGDNTSYGKKTADSYDQAIEVITEQLKKAGIPLDKGKIGMATLKDPRVPNLLSGTMDVFQESVKATVESNTLLNKAGSEANQEYEKIKNIDEPWARNLRTEFLMIQTRVLKKLSSSKLVEQVAKLATGQKVKAFTMSRMDANARGTFEGKLSPNIRIPMFYTKATTKTLITDPETDFILSVIGSGLDQAAMAGSLFKPDIKGETFRVFLPDRKITDDEATTFEKNVKFPLNLYDVPNGAVVEINIGGYDTRPTAASVRAALIATFGNNVNAKLAKASYKSTYLTKEKVEYAPSYREVIYDYRDSKFGRGNKNGFRRPFDDSLAKIGKSLIAIANERDGQFEEFTKDSKAKRTAYKQKIGSKTDWAVMGGPSGGKYQLTAARIDVDGVMRPTRNNKGSPIAATTEAVKNFWRWFGNSGVVDEKGYPRLVLHGTARDFEVFTPKQAGAIFFTDDPKFADTYSKQLSPNWMVDHYRDFLTAEQIESAKAETLRVMDNLTREEYRLTQKSSPEEFAEIYEWELAVKSRLPSGPNTMPIYVKMENPFDYENKSHVEAVVDKLLGSKKSIKFDQDVRALPPNPLSRDNLIRIIHGDKSKEGNAARGGFWSLIENNQVVAAIQSLGFDGLSMWEDGVKNYAVFKPTQVKSATGNRGTFDEKNPNIRYSIKSPDTPAFKRWFGDSKVVDKDGKPLVMYHGTSKDKDFTSFNVGMRGAWFSSSTEEASMYSTSNDSQGYKYEGGKFIAKNVAPRVMPVYLSIQNPYVLTKNDLEKLKGSNYAAAQRDVFSNARSRGFDGIDLGGGAWVVLKSPIQIKSAIGNRGTFDETKKDIRYSLSSSADLFDPKLIDKNSSTGFKSRTKLIDMNIDDFLKLATPGYTKSKELDVEKALDAGKKLETLPSLVAYQENSKGNLIIDGNNDPSVKDINNHEGRHRARALKKRGYTTMPVLLTTNIRFSEQKDPRKFDYIKDWPKKIIGYDGNTADFPVSREDSGKDYQPQEPVKYSLRDDIRSSMGQGHLDAVDRVSPARVNATFANRMASAISPDGRTAFRQRYLNKYESIERLSKRIAASVGQGFRGQAELLADTSAIAATLQSDRASGVAAEAFVSGVPVYKNGFTKVSDLNGRVKGLIPIFEPLMKYKDPFVFQMFQFYAATKRGSRLMRKGILTPVTQADLKIGADYAAKFPEFVTVFNDYQEFNKGLVRFLIDTGVLTKSMGDEFMKYSDYIPFYRQLEGQDTVGPKLFNSLSGVRPPQKMKGGDAPLADFMETVVRNARAAIDSGMKNVASQRIARDVMRLNSPNAPYAQRLNNNPGGFDVIKVRENGIDVSYRVADPLLVEAMSSMHNVGLGPLWQMAAYPTQLLRNLVTKDPSFMLANLIRDSMQAWSTSGTSMVPIVDTFKQFAKVLANQSPEARALKAAGIGAGYEFAGDIKASTEAVQEILRKRTGNLTSAEKAMLPLSKIWDTLEKGSNASDLATRAEIYKRTMQRTGGNEAEAMYQALEVMNFGRMGNSPMIQVISALVPFFNARIQGLDVLFRSAGGYSSMFGTMATENNATQQKAFVIRTMTILGLSMMYYMLASDSDEYKRASAEVRDNNWIIGKVKIPIPFEIGVLFKVMPERIAAYYFGNDTGKDLQASAIRNIVSTLKVNPVPQIALPLVELAANHSFFTGEDITPKSMEHVAPQFQERSGTSEWAKKLSAAISEFAPEKMKLSPIQIDYLLSGYTGTMGAYAGLLVDSIINTAEGKTKPSMSIEQTPVLKRFFASDKSGGTMTAFYDLKEQVDEVTRTSKLLLERGNVDDYRSYMQEKGKLLALKPLTENIDTKLSELRKLRNMVNFSKMGSDEKRQTLDNIRMAEIRMTEQIQGLKKRFAQM